VTCATMASCDDFDDIVVWANTISPFCGASQNSIMVSRASAGCVPSSTGSTRSCSAAVSTRKSRPRAWRSRLQPPFEARPGSAFKNAGAQLVSPFGIMVATETLCVSTRP
jgi:hypothetical protein